MFILLIILFVILVYIFNCRNITESMYGSVDHLYTMPIYVINLATRCDKKSRMLEELARQRLTANAYFLVAIDGDKTNYSNSSLPKREIGRYLSHYQIWKRVVEDKIPCVVVMEDDIYLADLFRSNFNTDLDRLKGIEWDIFYLGPRCYNFTSSCNAGRFVDDNILFPEKRGEGTYAYAITYGGAKKLVETTVIADKTIDEALEDNKEIKVVALIDPMVGIYSSVDTQR